jgi:hypothetical protein
LNRPIASASERLASIGNRTLPCLVPIDDERWASFNDVQSYVADDPIPGIGLLNSTRTSLESRTSSHRALFISMILAWVLCFVALCCVFLATTYDVTHDDFDENGEFKPSRYEHPFSESSLSSAAPPPPPPSSSSSSSSCWSCCCFDIGNKPSSSSSSSPPSTSPNTVVVGTNEFEMQSARVDNNNDYDNDDDYNDRDISNTAPPDIVISQT